MTVTSPLASPPAAAMYVKVIVRPVCEAETLAIDAVSVPEPSFAFTVIDGDVARFVKTPPAVARSWNCHVCTPGVTVAVAPGPPPLVSP